MNRALLFVRRSTKMQGMSLDDQKKLLIKWMKTATIFAELKIDTEPIRIVEETGTGTRLGPGIKGILDEVRRNTNEYTYIIAEKIDRFYGRMGSDIIPYLKELKAAGVFLITADTGTVRNSFDSFVGNIHTLLDTEVAQQESRNTAVRMVGRGTVKSEEGYWLGGTPPFGYKRMEISYAGEELGTLAYGVSSREENRVRLVLDDPDKGAAVKHIFEQAAQGVYFDSLVKWMNQKGCMTYTGSSISRSTLRDILKNPIYKGDQTWGKRRQGIFSRNENLWNDSGLSWHHDRDKWIVYHDEKLRIVSDEIFEAVQTRFANQPREYAGPKHPPKFALLDKLLYCEICGTRYYYREEQRGNYLLKRYREYGKNRAINCKGRVILARTLHEYAENLIDSLIEPEVISSAFDRAREIVSADSGFDITLEKSLEPEINRLKMEEKNLIKVLKVAPKSRGLVMELNKVCDQLEQLRSARDQIRNGELSIDLASIDELERESLSFREIWSRGSAENRQRVAKAFIQKVEISKDRSTATWEYRSAPDAVCRIQCRGGDSNPHILADTGF